MKLLPLLALAFVAGCQTKYTKFTVTDFEGDRVATWVAEGSYAKVDQTYRIRAVERLSAGPHEVLTKYPNGWTAIVVGQNIVREPVPKPEWLVELDGK